MGVPLREEKELQSESARMGKSFEDQQKLFVKGGRNCWRLFEVVD